MISIVICTRNRGASIVQTLDSVFANDHPSFEVIVIDQSKNNETEEAITPYCQDRRFRYIRSDIAGLGRNRNIGLRVTKGDIVAYTDDDCTVPEDWLEKLEQAFQVNSKIAVVFCQVNAASYDCTAGFIPEYLILENKQITSLIQKNSARGIGAGMAVRRDLVCAMGGFDDYLGAGGYFPSCEDGDIAVRALIHGNYVFETNDISVIHYGFRTWAQGKSLAKRNWVAIGAAYAKPLKYGHWGILNILIYEGINVALVDALKPLINFRRPRGLRNFLYFVQGFWRGLWMPVDKKTLKFYGKSKV